MDKQDRRKNLKSYCMRWNLFSNLMLFRSNQLNCQSYLSILAGNFLVERKYRNQIFHLKSPNLIFRGKIVLLYEIFRDWRVKVCFKFKRREYNDLPFLLSSYPKFFLINFADWINFDLKFNSWYPNKLCTNAIRFKFFESFRKFDYSKDVCFY